jgi:hypothetical protein
MFCWESERADAPAGACAGSLAATGGFRALGAVRHPKVIRSGRLWSSDNEPQRNASATAAFDLSDYLAIPGLRAPRAGVNASHRRRQVKTDEAA